MRDLRRAIAAIGLGLAACAKPPPPRCPTPTAAPPAPVAATTPDPLTSLTCRALEAKPDAAPIVRCGAQGCDLAYTATRMTTSPAGYRVGAPVAVEASAAGWRLGEDGERLHVEIVDVVDGADAAPPRLVIDGFLTGGFGSEGTAGSSYAGVAATPGAGAPRMAAVSIAGAPTAPAVTRDELRVGVTCDVATDLQE